MPWDPISNSFHPIKELEDESTMSASESDIKETPKEAIKEPAVKQVRSQNPLILCSDPEIMEIMGLSL